MGKSFSKLNNNHKRKKCNENSEVNLSTYANEHACGARRFNPPWAKKGNHDNGSVEWVLYGTVEVITNPRIRKRNR